MPHSNSAPAADEPAASLQVSHAAPSRTTQRKAAWAGSWATLRDLEVLLAVIEERKTTAAAIKLGVSQPAISRTLSQLEEKSGRVLFRHEGTAIIPTADALALYEEIRPIFESLDRLKDFQWAQARPVTLHVACAPTPAQCFLEPLTASFLRENPGTHVSIEIVTTPEVLELVADQRADVGIADVIPASSGLQRSAFRRSSMVCALPAHHRLCARSVITASDLHDEAMIMLAKRNPMRPIIDRLFSKAGCKPQVVMETTTAISAVNYAAHGIGIALVNPFPVLLAAPADVVFREFAPDMPYETSFFTSASAVPSSVAQKYMEHVRQHQTGPMFKSEPVN
jgi:DNA-binding transcriptional LysR family regulator